MADLLSAVRDYYDARYRSHGDSARGMDWKDEASQRLRFEVLLRHLDLSGSPTLLDVGCGNGELLRLIDARWPGRRLSGVDLSQSVVEQNRQALPSMEFFRADLTKPDDALPAGFDVVVCTEVIEHLDDSALAVKRLAEAVKPGGHVIITCPPGRVWPTERHFGHVRRPRRHDLFSWAEAAGLVVDELWSWGFPTYALTKWATNVRPEMALKAFAGERPYGLPQIAVSTALFAANFANLRSSRFGVQLFALFSRRS